MKILLVIPYFFPSVGGLENYALQIAKGLCKKGHTVAVVTSNMHAKQYFVEMIDGLTVYRLPISFTVSNTPVNFLWFFSIESIIKKEKPDVINGHTPVPFLADIAAILAKKHRIPFILTYQNDLVKDVWFLQVLITFYYFFLGLPTLRKADAIIASSQYYADGSIYLRRFLRKVEIVPPGVSLESFSDLSGQTLSFLRHQYKDKKVVLFIGQLDKTHEHKGLTYLLEAVQLIIKARTDAHLLVIGRGNYISFYKHLCEKLHVSAFVSFIGFVRDEELPYYYTSSDVVILPSYNAAEGFGMVLIEAGAAQKPVVASRVGGIPFVVKDRKTGLLTEPRDVKGLSEAILKILDNRRLQKELGRQNYLWVKENFTWDTQIDKTERLFNRFISM